MRLPIRIRVVRNHLVTNLMNYTRNIPVKKLAMKFLKSFMYALQGIRYCCVFERNFRVQLAMTAVTIFSGLRFQISAIDWMAILICLALVLGFEMVNTSIEKLADTITTSLHPSIKQVKDIAAGAVCLAAIFSSVIGCIIFIPKLLPLIKHLTK